MSSINLLIRPKQLLKSANSFATGSRPQPAHSYGDWNTSANHCLKWVISLIVDGNGEPLCIIELTEVEIKPFNAVDEQFAFEYGEGDRTLAFWLSDNWDFHSRWCIEIGREPSETMPREQNSLPSTVTNPRAARRA